MLFKVDLFVSFLYFIAPLARLCPLAHLSQRVVLGPGVAGECVETSFFPLVAISLSLSGVTGEGVRWNAPLLSSRPTQWLLWPTGFGCCGLAGGVPWKGPWICLPMLPSYNCS